MLKATKLNKYYHNFGRKPLHVINNTTIEIPETGIIAVVGESGAGKTTLINAISSLDSFKSGEIAFDDVKMRHYRNHLADTLRLKNYGFIFQNYYLLESQTVYENVKVSLDAFDISEAEKKKRVNYVLNQLGIARYTHKKVTSLSGGEQQRVSIARALVKSPRVIFADEPTGSLDEKTTFTVLNILKKVSQSCAVFIVTHERDIISYYADYVIELNNGVVVKESKPDKPDEKSLAVDRNVYLKELEHTVNEEKESVKINIYTDGSNAENSDIKIAIKDNKIYLEASDNIKVLTGESENHLIEGERYKIKDYVSDNFDYSLDPIPFSRNTLSFKDIIQKGYKNYKKKHPIKMILKIICAALSMVLLTVFEGFNFIQKMDYSDVLTGSKGNIYLHILPEGENMNTDKMSQSYEFICQAVETSDVDASVMFVSRDTLNFTYNGFFQLQQNKFILPNNDFKDIALLNEKSLIYGQTPTDQMSIVIDEYVLENFVNNTDLKTVVTDYGYFVGKTLNSTYDYELKIAGVCRTKSPTIYGHPSLNLFSSAYASHVRVTDIDLIRDDYPELKDVTIEPGHCWRSDFYGSVTFDSLIVDKRYGQEIPFDLIINPSDYLTLKLRAANMRGDMYLSCDGSKEHIEQVYDLLDRIDVQLKEKELYISMNAEYRYQDEVNEKTATFVNVLNSVKIIGVAIIVVALLLIILSTYLSMLNQISDIAVYRSLGYSRWHLGATYFFEISLLSLLYCFIGGAITYLAMFILDVIPIVPYTLSTPFVQFVGLILLISLVIMIIGLLPIMFVFRLTPAKIYSRYNHRINNEQRFFPTIISF